MYWAWSRALIISSDLLSIRVLILLRIILFFAISSLYLITESIIFHGIDASHVGFSTAFTLSRSIRSVDLSPRSPNTSASAVSPVHALYPRAVPPPVVYSGLDVPRVSESHCMTSIPHIFNQLLISRSGHTFLRNVFAINAAFWLLSLTLVAFIKSVQNQRTTDNVGTDTAFHTGSLKYDIIHQYDQLRKSFAFSSATSLVYHIAWYQATAHWYVANTLAQSVISLVAESVFILPHFIYRAASRRFLVSHTTLPTVVAKNDLNFFDKRQTYGASYLPIFDASPNESRSECMLARDNATSSGFHVRVYDSHACMIWVSFLSHFVSMPARHNSCFISPIAAVARNGFSIIWAVPISIAFLNASDCISQRYSDFGTNHSDSSKRILLASNTGADVLSCPISQVVSARDNDFHNAVIEEKNAPCARFCHTPISLSHVVALSTACIVLSYHVCGTS